MAREKIDRRQAKLPPIRNEEVLAHLAHMMLWRQGLIVQPEQEQVDDAWRVLAEFAHEKGELDDENFAKVLDVLKAPMPF